MKETISWHYPIYIFRRVYFLMSARESYYYNDNKASPVGSSSFPALPIKRNC